MGRKFIGRIWALSTLYPLPDRTDLLGGRYRIASYMARGGSSFVYVGRDNSGRKVIIKELVENQSCQRGKGQLVLTLLEGKAEHYHIRRQSFILEMQRMAVIHSPYIVGVRDYFAENQTLYLILDFIGGESLRTALTHQRTWSEYECAGVLLDGLNALRVLKTLNWVHCDVKPENIFLPIDGHALLLDMGSTYQQKRHSLLEAQADERDKVAITEHYSAPEFYAADSPLPVGTWSDIYSLGQTILDMQAHSCWSGAFTRFVQRLAHTDVRYRATLDLDGLIEECAFLQRTAAQ